MFELGREHTEADRQYGPRDDDGLAMAVRPSTHAGEWRMHDVGVEIVVMRRHREHYIFM